MMFRDMIAIDSESSTKAQETVGGKLISYMLETRGASDHILL
jgi:hypothetical protein